MALSGKRHYRKGEAEAQLFEEDAFAMSGLPDREFEVVRYEDRRTDKKGKFCVDGRHWYSTDPSLARRTVRVGLGAFSVRVYDAATGELVCEHPRAYGDAPTDSADPGSQLALLCFKTGSWRNSKVRSAVSDGLRAHMDSLGRDELRAELRAMRDANARSGWEATLQAAELAFAATGRVDAASVSVAAARAETGRVDYDEPVDLGVYDAAMRDGGDADAR